MIKSLLREKERVCTAVSDQCRLGKEEELLKTTMGKVIQGECF